MTGDYYKESTSKYTGGNDFIQTTELKNVLIIKRPQFQDDRGFFWEVFRKQDIVDRTGLEFEFVQGNHSRSSKDTLRGIHIAPWHKMITCTRGKIQQIVVDTNPDSPTFGQHLSIILGEDNFQSVFIPAGYGNAFLVLSDVADYSYSASLYWSPGSEKDLAWNDERLGIEWQSETPIVSEKDSNNPTMELLFPDKFN